MRPFQSMRCRGSSSASKGGWMGRATQSVKMLALLPAWLRKAALLTCPNASINRGSRCCRYHRSGRLDEVLQATYCGTLMFISRSGNQT